MNNIYQSFSDLLNDNQKEFDENVGKWLSDLKSCIKTVENHRKQFHQWSPLRIYISLGEIKEKPKFSLRFLGQEVGSIVVIDERPMLCISQTHYKNNRSWFAPGKSDKFGLPPKTYEWNCEESRKFRKDFKEIGEDPGVETGIPEHRIESAFIEEMELGKESKFYEKVGPIQPVRVAKCPLQIPLPISASKGVPEFKSGHIDILARRGKGRNVKLSVWELKSPKKLRYAVEQVYIYALTLLNILRRSPYGKEWYNEFCGRAGNVPGKLDIEAVVAITEDKENAFWKHYKRLVKENPLHFGDTSSDQISFFLALYDKDSLKIKSFARQ